MYSQMHLFPSPIQSDALSVSNKLGLTLLKSILYILVNDLIVSPEGTFFLKKMMGGIPFISFISF